MRPSKAVYADSIIIFDEGHNIPDAACSGFSGKVLSSSFEGALNNILDNDEE
jgi:Rad3-related DNA helicase